MIVVIINSGNTIYQKSYRIIKSLTQANSYWSMGRRQLIKNTVKNIHKIIPYSINTFYEQKADQLNTSPNSVKIFLNQQAVANRIARLKLTASQAQCAVLASTQVSEHWRMFVISKQSSKQKKWLSSNYNQPSQYKGFTNAKIISAKRRTIVSQQSASFPFIHADVNRYEVIQAQYLNEEGEKVETQMEGFEAFAYQQALDYNFNRHILDWRLHFGNIKIQEDAKEKLPKVTQVVEQYSREIKNLVRRYPQLQNMPAELDENNVGWLQRRGNEQNLSIEDDYMLRIYKHYRKDMLLFLERMELNIV